MKAANVAWWFDLIAYGERVLFIISNRVLHCDRKPRTSRGVLFEQGQKTDGRNESTNLRTTEIRERR